MTILRSGSVNSCGIVNVCLYSKSQVHTFHTCVLDFTGPPHCLASRPSAVLSLHRKPPSFRPALNLHTFRSHLQLEAIMAASSHLAGHDQRAACPDQPPVLPITLIQVWEV